MRAPETEVGSLEAMKILGLWIPGFALACMLWVFIGRIGALVAWLEEREVIETGLGREAVGKTSDEIGHREGVGVWRGTKGIWIEGEGEVDGYGLIGIVCSTKG